jgi:long-chain fatty acid transport protein
MIEAWGAKAAGMGGAGFGYDSGNFAIMNNPATLGLKSEGKAKIRSPGLPRNTIASCR